MAANISKDYVRFSLHVNAWAARLKATPAVLNAVAREIATELLNLTYERFKRQTDPYGKRWLPKKRPDGRGVLHGPTGRLKNGWFVHQATAKRILIHPSVKYAVYHQSSAPRRRLPRRMMLPDAKLGLPTEYAEAFEDVTEAVLSSHFEGQDTGALMAKMGFTRRVR
jgi:Phage virion morphogenesis family